MRGTFPDARDRSRGSGRLPGLPPRPRARTGRGAGARPAGGRLRDRPAADQGLHGVPRRARPRVRRRRRIGSAPGAARRGRDQLRLPDLRHLQGRPADALPQPHRARHPQSRRRICRPHCRAAGEPARGARFDLDRRRGVHRTGGGGLPDPGPDPDLAQRPHRGAGRRPPRQSLCAGAGRAVGPRDRGRQASREAGAAPGARHRHGARDAMPSASAWPTSSSSAPAPTPACRRR